MLTSLRRRIPGGLTGAGLLSVLAAVIAVGAHQTGVLDGIERASIDARFTIRGDRAPNPSILIVGLDRTSIGELPPVPIPRRYWAQLIDILHADGAREIAFDIAFDSPADRSDDDALRAAASRARPVLFGSPNVHLDGTTDVLGGPVDQHAIGARIGATLLPFDPDGSLRRVLPSVYRIPSFAVAAAHLLGHNTAGEPFGSHGALIDYAGPAGTYPSVGVSQVLDHAVDPSRIRGKTVLIGATAPALQDIHATPEGTMSGVEIWANTLSTVLAGLPLQPVGLAMTALLTLLLSAVAPLLATRVGVFAAVGGWLGAAVVYLVGAQLAFSGGTVLDVSTPEFGGLLCTALAVLASYVTADRERQRLREQFANFTPEVVEAVLSGNAEGLPATEVVAGYRLVEVLGQGGMAVVYRAMQLDLPRAVALKLISPQFAQEPQFRERFLREFRLAATVEHPHVIPIYQAGEDHGLLFIVMRLIEGVDLDVVLQRMGPLPPDHAVRIITQVAQALDAAHAAGLVHRDVKPSNVLLDVDLEYAYLTDFGIARQLDDAALTAVGAFVGTAAYAAPEQGEGGELDGRADIYALGAVLYHVLTGAPPYGSGSNTIATLMAHATAPVPTVSATHPGLAAFDAVIARAMAKEPADRFGTAGELASAAAAAVVPLANET